jgi:hypothetical protein
VVIAASALWQPPGFEAAAIRPVTAANAGASVNLFEGGRIPVKSLLEDYLV